jgi:hypothetical protein
MYKVIKFFTDLQDNNFPYNVDDIYPRKGLTVSEERLAELAGSKNKQGQPLIVLIEKVTEAAAPKKTTAKKATKKAAEN